MEPAASKITNKPRGCPTVAHSSTKMYTLSFAVYDLMQVYSAEECAGVPSPCLISSMSLHRAAFCCFRSSMTAIANWKCRSKFAARCCSSSARGWLT